MGEQLTMGLTGGIASGKSTVARIFCELGALHLDADQLARQVVNEDPALLQALVREFGAAIRDGQGGLDRAALGRVVFADAEARARLEAMTHPAIIARARRELSALRGRGAPVIYEAALLVETGRYLELDLLVVVVANMEVRRQRLMQRDGLSPEEVEERFAAQLPQEQKAALADHVIDNSGSLQETRTQVEQVWREIERG